MTLPRLSPADDDRLARSERLGRVGSWEWDPRRRQVVCSKELQRLLGLPTANPTDGALLRCVPPDDRRLLRKLLDELVSSTARVRSLEHRVRRPDGGERLVRHEIERVPAEDGLWRLAGALRELNPRELPGAGVAPAPQDAEDCETPLARAEAGLAEAGREGPGHSRRCASGHTQAVERRRRIEVGLRSALADSGLSLHYQPIVEASSGHISKLEALLRWTDPVLGSVSPAEFVPIAEELGLIADLGHWALRESLRQLRSLRGAGFAIGMSVNVSALQLRSPGFVGQLERALAQSGADPRHVDLELTEGVLIGDEPEVIRALAAVKELGLGLLIDDFGTGYCSLRYLQQLRIDALKVDRAFVSRIEDRQGGAALVAAIIAIAHRLGLLAIAEGVENFVQEDFLRSEGCDLLQGFSLGLPSTAEALQSRLLREAELAR